MKAKLEGETAAVQFTAVEAKETYQRETAELRAQLERDFAARREAAAAEAAAAAAKAAAEVEALRAKIEADGALITTVCYGTVTAHLLVGCLCCARKERTNR